MRVLETPQNPNMGPMPREGNRMDSDAGPGSVGPGVTVVSLALAHFAVFQRASRFAVLYKD